MRKSIAPNAIHTLYGVFLITFILLTASCGESATPTKEQTPTSTSLGDVTEWTDSATKISPGQHLRFDTISLEQGLSQSTVFCMLQDSQGFMWFGTEEGLNKYDGYAFTVYMHDPEDPNSMDGNRISALLEDDSGTLWIGTGDGGLNRYDRKLDQFTHYRNDPDDPSSLSVDDVTGIYQDQDGVLWIGTGGGGLDRLVLSEAKGSDQENERFIHYQHDPDDPNSLSSNAVSSIYQDQEGALWIGTDGGGLNRLVLPEGHRDDVSEVEGLERENERWWHYVNDPSDPHSLSHNNITAIFEDQSGSIWVGTDGGGLDRFDQEKERFIHYQHDPDDAHGMRESLSSDEITAIYQDRDGVLWIGTSGGGLNIFDPEKETFAHYQNVPGDPHSLSSNVVLSIFQDREGVLWFGSHGGGASKLDVGRWDFAHYKNDPNNPNSLGDNMVWVLYQDRGGALWIGTMLGGLNRFERETGNWRHYRHDLDDPDSLSNDWVSVIYEDRSGVLWIGTRSGLDRFEPETETFTHYQADPDGPPRSRSNNVLAIYQGHEGDFWIGTEGGLYGFDREKESWSQSYRHDSGDPDSLSSDMVLSFLEDRDGMLWIGTARAGLIRFDPEKETFTQYQNDPGNPRSLSSNAVVSIFQDREGVLWISTLGGLDKLVLPEGHRDDVSEAEGFNPGTGAFTHYREKDGLPNDTVHCTVEDGKGNLWVSTNKGLSRFDPQRETFRNYDVTDGLQSNEFNASACHVSDSEEMFFGGINGFNVFFPEHVQDNPTVPPVVLTYLAQGGEEVNLEIPVDSVTEVTLEWPDNAFEFEFAALSFAQPEKNQYAYYLDGFEETWNEVETRRYGQYTNLPGGTYTLRVRGSNNDGIWNKVGTAIKITVVPPFWATWWFRGILFIALVGIVLGAYRLRVRNLEARGRELESQVAQRTAELMQIEETLRQSEMEKAVSAERSRLARDLHDAVTQTLFSASLIAETLPRSWERDQEKGHRLLEELRQLSRGALAEMRTLLLELRPAALVETSLSDLLHQLAEAATGQGGVPVEVTVEGECTLPQDVHIALYRITQEALNNVTKHARAGQVTVHLSCTPFPSIEADGGQRGKVKLVVSDDGRGFNPDEVSPDSLGLGIMQERAEAIGATLEIESGPGHGSGTQIKVIW